MRKLLLLLSLIAIATQAWAIQKDVELAKREAMGFVRTESRLKSVNPSKLELAYTAGSDSRREFYVFAVSGDKGYVVVSADDCATSILGYSSEGTFDANNIPDGMKFMFEEYSAEIKYALEHNAESSGTARPRIAEERSPIAPLCLTIWNQSWPYNNLCPDYDGTLLCVTGCVATAMAQIMRYHRWPVQGAGSNTYTTEINGTAQTLSLDFSTISFYWENMPATYTENSTIEEQDAVAKLMQACGIAVNMSYGLSSGAYSFDVPHALVNYFDYDKGALLIERSHYGVEQWHNTIYTELSEKRPVYVSGSNTNAGHAFVCDGYDKDDYFHFNWGWGGIANGYFRFTALDPSTQGIGGSNAGYSGNITAIVGVKPDAGGEARATVSYGLDFVTNVASSADAADGLVGFKFGKVTLESNYADGETDIMLGVIVENTATKTSTFAPSDLYWVLKRGYTYSRSDKDENMYVELGNLIAGGDGNYRIYPGYYDTEHEVTDKALVPMGCIDHVDMVVEGGNATFTSPTKGVASLLVPQVTFNTSFYTGKQYSVTATISNSGAEYYGDVLLAVINEDNQIQGNLAEMRVAVPADGTVTSTIMAELGDVAPGNYYFAIAGTDYEIISDVIPIEVKEAPSSYRLNVTNLAIESPESVNPLNMHVSATLNCTEGYFFGRVSMWVFGADGSSLSYENSPYIAIDADGSHDLNMELSFNFLEEGKKYYMAAYVYDNGWSQLCPAVPFYASWPTGVESNRAAAGDAVVAIAPGGGSVTVKTGEEIEAVRLHTLSGVLVATAGGGGTTATIIDTAHLPHGVYVVTVVTPNSTTTRKIVK